MNRYIVTNNGMMKGYWKIYDTLTGKVNDTGIASKAGAQRIADTYNARDYGIWEHDRQNEWRGPVVPRIIGPHHD